MSPGRTVKHVHHAQHTLAETIESFFILLTVALFVVTFLVQPFRIPSESMEPTLLVGDFLLVDRVAFAPAGIWRHLLPYRDVQRGDIVVFRFPVDPAQYLVKRTVAIAGDKVHLHNSTLYVNGQPVKEKYVQYLPAGTDPYRDEFPASVYSDDGVDPAWWIQLHSLVKDGEITVPPGDLFVMGDNRNRSLDSRYWGFVPRANVVGRPLLIYFSLNAPGDEPQAVHGGASSPGSAGNGPQNVRMSHSDGIARWLNFARWGRMFRIVR